MNVTFVGAGSMGGAIMAGLIAGGFAPESMSATTNSEDSAEALQADSGVSARALETDPAANLASVANADLVFVGVKPGMLESVLSPLAGHLKSGAVIVSMAAGTTLSTLREYLPGESVVRIMPNTPVAVGQGVVAIARGEDISDDVIEQLRTVLEPLGHVLEVPESELGAITAVAGSGVAYFFLLAEHLVGAGTDLGLDADAARQVVAATATGAGALLAKDPDPHRLRTSVVSKGGTTQAALDSFADAGFADIVAQAARAAAARSRAMEADAS